MLRNRIPWRKFLASTTAVSLAVGGLQLADVVTPSADAQVATEASLADRTTITYPAITVAKDGNVLIRPTNVDPNNDFSITTVDGPHALIAESDGQLGELSIEGKTEGTHHSEIELHFSDNSTKRLTLTITVTPAGTTYAETYQPSYAPFTLGVGGEPVELSIQGAPQQSTFSASNLPDWISLNGATGALRIVPTRDEQLGRKTFTVTITYPDHSSENISVDLTLAAPQAEGENPTWASRHALAPGKRAQLDSMVKLPAGTRVSVVRPEGFEATLGQDSALHLSVPANSEAGSAHTVVLRLDYLDHSFEEVTVPILIAPTVTSTPNSRQLSLSNRVGVRWEKAPDQPQWWTLDADGVIQVSDQAPAGAHELHLVGHFLSTYADATVRIQIDKHAATPSPTNDPEKGKDVHPTERESSSGWKVWLPILLAVGGLLVGAVIAVLTDKNNPLRALVKF